MVRFCGSPLGRRVTIMVGLPIKVVSPLREAMGTEYVLAVKGTHGTFNGG
jgi:hypothetical protein